jgi:hypothetical protein
MISNLREESDLDSAIVKAALIEGAPWCGSIGAIGVAP